MIAALHVTAIADLAVPVAAPSVIRPVAGRSYRLVSEDVRDDGLTRRRFMRATTLTFRQEPGGWLVESMLVDLHAEPEDRTAARFMTGAGALRGRTIRVHLDAAGHFVSVDDEEAIWTALLAGIAAMADARPTQTLALARDPTAAMRGLPRDARLAMIAAAVRAAVPPRPTPGERPVTLPNVEPGQLGLTGTERVMRADGQLRDQTDAFVEASGGAQSLNRVRRIDMASGLLIDAVDRRTIRIGSRVHTIEQRDRLTLVP